VPARFERKHDIGSLWPPVASKARRNKAFNAQNPGLIERLEANAWVRNKVGAHYDESEAAITPKEVRSFAEALANLYSATHCDICRSFIQKRDAKLWACDCSALGYIQ
jgi:hypothetical protein